jgi:hypothetical protein
LHESTTQSHLSIGFGFPHSVVVRSDVDYLLHLVELSDGFLFYQNALSLSHRVTVRVEVWGFAEIHISLLVLDFGGVVLLVGLHQLEIDVHVDLH